MRWTVLATAPDQITAEIWRDLLLSDSIPSMMKPGDAVSFMGVSPYPCRLLVPEDRVDQAKEVLGDQLGTTGS